jgi:hypothetical protein
MFWCQVSCSVNWTAPRILSHFLMQVYKLQRIKWEPGSILPMLFCMKTYLRLLSLLNSFIRCLYIAPTCPFLTFSFILDRLLYSSYFLRYVILDICLSVCLPAYVLACLTWKVIYGPLEIYHKATCIQSSGPQSCHSKRSFSALHFVPISLNQNIKLYSLCKNIHRRQSIHTQNTSFQCD